MNQRWLFGRPTWRPAGEVIDPSQYGVEVLPDDRRAKAFVERHHYSGSYPAARCRVGLYRMRELVGVAVFSVPAQAAALAKWTGTSVVDGIELGRFVLVDDVPGNGETWFLARAIRAMRAELPEVRAILSYSDPMPRRTADGVQVTGGHIGTIYQAHNARYLGRSSRETLILDRAGRTVSRRSLSKLRNGERSAGVAYRRLLEAGAPPRQLGEGDAAYVARALAEGPFQRVRHPGNHVYAWPLSRDVQLPPVEAYPKRESCTILRPG